MRSVSVPIYKKGDETDRSNYRGISLLPNTYKTLSNILLSRLTPYAEKKVLGIINVDFDATSQLLITHSSFVKYLRKNGNTTKQCISSLHFKKAYDSVRREALYNILIEFHIPMKLVRLIKMSG